MRKYILTCVMTSAFAASAFAQVPEDVLKYSWQPVHGTARVNAIGGAMGSLGGDITATYVNPAGIGFYKTTDIVLSPGINFLKNNSNFRGTGSSDKTSGFALGPTGIVGGWRGANNWHNSLSLVVNTTGVYRNKIYYTGRNDFSSGAEQYAAELANSGADIGSGTDVGRLSYGTQMAVWNYLIDTTTLPGHNSPDVISLAMWDALKNGGPFAVNQTHSVETTGSSTDIALGYATSHADKIYIGASFGLPIVKYTRKSTYREEDATASTNNNFDFYQLDEKFTTKGFGANVKFGLIYKPVEFVRIGMAIHTPTWYTFEDSYDGRMDVNLEQYRRNPGTTSVTVSQIYGSIPTYKYELVSPWKFLLSGSYVIREIEDVRKQKGFLTADVEYVTYKSNKFRNAEDYANDDYYTDVNNVMKNYYKNALNFRVGGELKFTTVMARLGFSYYGSPYQDKELKANKMFLSGGVGYRNAGMFIDLTYTHAMQKDTDFPYRLPDKANTFANVKGQGSNVSLTVGFKI